MKGIRRLSNPPLPRRGGGPHEVRWRGGTTAPFLFFRKERSLRSRPSTSLRLVPLLSKSRGGFLGLLAAALLGGMGVGAAAQVDTGRWPAVHSRVARDPAIEARIDAMMARMSLEQKVAQVIQPDIASITPEEYRHYHFGSILAGGNSSPGGVETAPAREWLALADRFWDASMDVPQGELAIPVMWGIDAVHGHANIVGATIFPQNIGLGAMRDPDLIRRIGQVTAVE